MKSINKNTKNLLEKLSQDEFFKKNRTLLIGGTALAFHLEHRESFDLDLCLVDNRILPPLDFLTQYGAKKIYFGKKIEHEAINDGGDVYDYHQRFDINGVKVDITVNTGSNIYEKDILTAPTLRRVNNIEIASMDAIFSMKSLLLLDRNKVRDLYDVAFLLTHQDYNAKQFLDVIKKYRITYQDKDILRILKAKKQKEYDAKNEPIKNPKWKINSYSFLKSIIIKEINRELKKTKTKTRVLYR